MADHQVRLAGKRRNMTDLKTVAARPGTRAAGALGLHVVHPWASAGFRPFADGRHVIGRNPACAIPLEGRAVSWEHAELRIDGPRAMLRDLESTNGVLVDGQPISEVALDDGKVVRLGDVLAVVGPTPPAPLDEPPFAEAEALRMYVGPPLAAALAPLARGRDTRLLLLGGETGTGKALAARLVHARSSRAAAGGAFAAFDGALLDHAGAARQLFGEAGALAHAAAGTSYLANVTALHLANQRALAQALRTHRGPLQLILGSQEPLVAARAAGRLEPTLHQTLADLGAIAIDLPPLRRRAAEIPGLFRHLFQQHGPGRVPGFSTDLVERLCLYDWPCNVREMVLLVERLATLHGDEPRLRSAHLPARLMPPDQEKTTSPVTPVNGVDSSSLLDALRKAGGSIEQAAASLGITRERAYRLIDRLGPAAGRAGA
jgi:two-component system, NtrC family, response regulator GlrR